MKPDYRRSIVNLMTSIGRARGGKGFPYKQLSILPAGRLQGARNIVLLIIDGLGYNYLMPKGGSFIRSGLIGSITSVFPPTTSASITSFMTAVAPQQHAVTGWFVQLKEVGVATTFLPFHARMGSSAYSEHGVTFDMLLDTKGFSERIKTQTFHVTHSKIVDSDYNRSIARRAKRLGYATLDGFFRQVKKAIGANTKKKFIYAYWPTLDSLAHKNGIKSKAAADHFRELDRKMESFVRSLKNTTVIITADHGFIDTTKSRVINLDRHPKLKECLSMPLSGEARLAYCYVHPSKAKQFESYVKRNLKHACDLVTSEQLVRRGYYGLGRPNPKLHDRIGDYVLVMKENYIIKDRLVHHEFEYHTGNHGGVSADEMLVPLIVFEV